jgi:hypothetical protein
MSKDLELFQKQLLRILKKRKTLRSRIAKMAVTRFGARAVQDFMILGGKEDDPGPVNAERLTVRSQTLSRAVLGGPGSRFRTRVTERALKLIWTIFVPYAAIHEFGGTIKVVVTAKMRSFFWAMWFETKDDKWKAMALTKKTEFKIEMRKRPYANPAVTVELPAVQQRAAEIMIQFIEDIIGA